MCSIFRSKKQKTVSPSFDDKMVSNNASRSNYRDNSFSNQNMNNTIASQSNSESADNKASRLMALVGKAIEEWAKEYNLENLPKSILFQQALDAMKIMEPLFTNDDTSEK